MSMRIYFLRHGESEANKLGIYAQDDTPLTPNGREQAVQALESADLPAFDRVISSDLVRARQTAELVAPELGLAIELDSRLREVNVGLLKGQEDKHMAGYFVAAETEGNPMQVESLEATKQRLNEFIASLAGSEGNILLVGHSGSGMLLRQIIAGDEPSSDSDDLQNGKIVKFGEISS